MAEFGGGSAVVTSKSRIRIPLGILDQLVSSVGNLAVTLVVARSSSVEDFGAFALVYLIFGLGLGAVRAAGGDVLLLSVRRAQQETRAQCRVLLGTVLWVCLVAGVLLIGIAMILPKPMSGLVLALGISLPGLLVQDALRYCFFAQGRPGSALVNDILWLTVQAGLFAVILGGGWPRSPAAFLLAWGIGAYVAAMLGLYQASMLPSVRGPRHWIGEHRDRIWSFLSDYALMMGATQLAIVLVGLIAGLPAVAGLRVAQLLFIPFHTVFASVRIMVMPGLANAASLGHPVIRRRARRMAGWAALAAVAYSVPVALLPDDAGNALFGATWDRAEPLVWALAVVCVTRTLSIPVIDALRALGGGRRLVTIRMANSLVLLTTVCALAAVFGVSGAAIGLALSTALASALWWTGLIRASSVAVMPGQRPGEGGDDSPVSDGQT